jgi:glycerol-1-phosphate dehydrogenase [NAD(P)+]
MDTNLPVYIGNDAVEDLISYCERHSLNRFTLVADQNTYAAAGQALDAILKNRGFDVKTVILTGREIVADEHYLMQLLLHADPQDRTYLAVGSGTLTDITRFISHRTRANFISVPTAPSVDGFTSIGAPLVIGGLKQTILCQPPLAVFADLDILSEAPQAMIASGFGDMLGKYTSVADWRLGHLLWDEPFNEAIAERTWRAVESCVQQVAEIGQGSVEGVRSLMEGLIESGLCMLDFGSSRPASGAEHHLSHYWEMKLLQEKRPAILHGAKVGIATIMVARRFEEIGHLDRQQVIEKLDSVPQPDREQELQRIRAAYVPEVAEQIIAEHAPFLDMSRQEYDLLKEKIIDAWPQVQEIAASVPPARQLHGLLQQVSGPTAPQMIGLSEDEVRQAIEYGHYLRNRFTIRKLGRMLGIS